MNFFKRAFPLKTALLMFFSMFLILIPIYPQPASAGKFTGEVVEIIDGDTIRVRIEKDIVTVRYLLIDTPELHHPKRPVEELAEDARIANEELVKERIVSLETDTVTRDRYGRILAYVWLKEKDREVLVNEVMILKGFALPMTIPPNLKYDERISRAFRKARKNSTGLWESVKGRIFTAEQAWWEMPYIDGKFFILDLKVRSIIQSGSRHIILPSRGNFSVVIYDADWKECSPLIPQKGGSLKIVGKAETGFHGGEILLADPCQIITDP
jgi:micrococcal nuclease